MAGGLNKYKGERTEGEAQRERERERERERKKKKKLEPENLRIVALGPFGPI